VIGSPETLLGIAECPARQAYQRQIVAEGRQGMRHLAVAYRLVGNGEPADIRSLEHDLTLLGFVALSDPLRPGTADTIAAAGRLGVTPKILTGDSAEVAGYVAGQVGLRAGNSPVLSGADVSKLSDADLAVAARRSNVFARVSPEQKYQLISALKQSDVVGYEGDGINDAPSLKLADVGIAVDSATDVAKANADIILLDRKLAVIITGIRNGRAIFANINKYIIYTMVGNFGNFIALTVLFLLATGLPLLPGQLLLLSLLTDLPLVAISTDSVDAASLSRPAGSTAPQLLSVSLVLGGLTAVAEMLFFLTVRTRPLLVAETSLYLFLSFTQLIVIFCVRNHSYFWRACRPSWPLLAAMSLTAIAAVAVTYIPPLAHLFSFTGLSAAEIGRMALWLVVYFLALDLLKVSYYRLLDGRWRARHSAAPASALSIDGVPLSNDLDRRHSRGAGSLAKVYPCASRALDCTGGRAIGLPIPGGDGGREREPPGVCRGGRLGRRFALGGSARVRRPLSTSPDSLVAPQPPGRAPQ
jgi:P-type Mg2+ transporter